MNGTSSRPKVSIIIPAYNVAEYIRECLTTALNQTYTKLEIIVVNDGSTDNTAAVCTECIHGRRDATLINKENGGLSSARNAGLQYATGEYVLFLDGDDVLDLGCVEYLVGISQSRDADLVVFKLKRIESQIGFHGTYDPSSRSLSSECILRNMLLLRGETGSACGKLISRDLLPNLPFPEGQLFEDFGVIAEILSKAKRIEVADSELYGYTSRRGSITRKNEYGKQHIVGMRKSFERVAEVIMDYPSLSSELRCFRAFCGIRVMGKTNMRSGDLDCFESGLRREALWVSAQNYVDKVWRLRCLLFATSPKLYKHLLALYENRSA